MAPDPLVVMEHRVLEMERMVRRLGRPLTPEEKRHLTAEVGRIRETVADLMAARMEKAEVISRGRPHFRRDMSRARDEARRRLGETRAFRECRSDCPAATAFAGAGGDVVVRCGVERAKLSSADSPQSLLTFCLGEYRLCPTWRAERQRLAEGAPPLVLAEEGE